MLKTNVVSAKHASPSGPGSAGVHPAVGAAAASTMGASPRSGPVVSAVDIVSFLLQDDELWDPGRRADGAPLPSRSCAGPILPRLPIQRREPTPRAAPWEALQQRNRKLLATSLRVPAAEVDHRVVEPRGATRDRAGPQRPPGRRPPTPRNPPTRARANRRSLDPDPRPSRLTPAPTAPADHPRRLGAGRGRRAGRSKDAGL